MTGPHIQTYKWPTNAYDRQAATRRFVELEISIDWDKLARALADKAFSNKSGRTQSALGITARIRKAPRQ